MLEIKQKHKFENQKHKQKTMPEFNNLNLSAGNEMTLDLKPSLRGNTDTMETGRTGVINN